MLLLAIGSMDSNRRALCEHALVTPPQFQQAKHKVILVKSSLNFHTLFSHNKGCGGTAACYDSLV